MASISPDGRWLAYTSDASGRDEIYVTSFPDSRRRWQLSSAGGRHPQWRADGSELYYLDGEALMAVSVTTGPDFTHGTPAMLFWAERLSDGFAASRDGKRFLTLRTDHDKSDDRGRGITVVQNWFAEFADAR